MYQVLYGNKAFRSKTRRQRNGRDDLPIYLLDFSLRKLFVLILYQVSN